MSASGRDDSPLLMNPSLKISVLIVAACLVTSSAAAAQRSQTNAASLSAGIVRGFPGATSHVPITMLSTGSVVAAQFDLGYPVNRLSPSPIADGTFGSDAVVRWREI